MEVTLRPAEYNHESNEKENELRYVTDLIIKHLKHTISSEEKIMLDYWLNLSDHNKKLFSELPQTDDMEVLYYWLLERWGKNRSNTV
ncbi:MAG TPA: hypothetical protein VF487_12465 [Chitinophagaceae bacterium]